MKSREEWLAARRQGVSASDVAGILGLSQYATPFSVYSEKVGLVADREATDEMEFGKDIEQIVAKKWAKRNDRGILWLDELYQGPEAWILATPDAQIVGKDEGLEVKTLGYKNDHWGREGTDEVPDNVVTQAQWQMKVMGWNAVHVAAFYTGPRKLESFLVYADPHLQTQLVEKCRQFWVENVLAQVAPDLDWSDASGAYLRQRFPHVVENDAREATDEEGDLAVAYANVSADLKRLEKAKASIGNQLKEKIGEAKSIVGPGFKVSWYEVAASTYEVHRKAGRTLKGSGQVFKAASDDAE